MKRILVFVLLVLNLSAFACDNCNVYVGINPNDFYHNFGLRLRTRFHQGTFDNSGALRQKHGGEESIYTNSTVKETYQRIEIAGRYFWNPRWNTQIIAPYVMNTQEVNESVHYFVQGIGDVFLLQNYMVFNTKDEVDSASFKHRLSVGLGVKLPTGSINVVRPLGTPNVDLQPGTGSWDGLASLTYTAMYNNLGLMVNGNFKANTYNRDNFKYGNTLNSTVNVFCLWNVVGHFQLVPSLGVYVEIFAKDSYDHEQIYDSGGSSWMLDGGISSYFKKIKIQLNYQYALNNLLVNKQQIPTKWRYNIGVYYNF